jgi:hypothetical protein
VSRLIVVGLVIVLMAVVFFLLSKKLEKKSESANSAPIPQEPQVATENHGQTSDNNTDNTAAVVRELLKKGDFSSFPSSPEELKEANEKMRKVEERKKASANPISKYIEELLYNSETLEHSSIRLENSSKKLNVFFEELISTYGRSPELSAFIEEMKAAATELSVADTTIAQITAQLPQRLKAFKDAFNSMQKAEESMLISRARHIGRLENYLTTQSFITTKL